MKERCEACFRMFATRDVVKVGNDRLCKSCAVVMKARRKKTTTKTVVKPTKKIVAKKTVKQTEDKLIRCDGCNNLRRRENCSETPRGLICSICSAPKMQWFAVACRGSDAKVRTQILKQCRAEHPDMIGRVVIPKKREMKISKNRWTVYDRNDEPITVQDGRSGMTVVAMVSAEDADEAIWMAEKQWGEDFDVHRVELTKEGGKRTFQNVRAMPGYLLVQCMNDDRVFLSIKQTRGVYSLLPYPEDLKYTEKALSEGDGPPRPASLDEEEVERMIAKPEVRVVNLNFKVGETVRVIAGPFQGQQAVVTKISGDGSEDPSIEATVEILGRRTPAMFSHTQLSR